MTGKTSTTCAAADACSSPASVRFVCGAGVCELTCCSQWQLALETIGSPVPQEVQAVESPAQQAGCEESVPQQQLSTPSPVTHAQSGQPHWAKTTPGSNAYAKTATKAVRRVIATEKPNIKKSLPEI